MDIEQYKVCKERGHKSNGVAVTNTVFGALTHYWCKYCGIEYYFQPEKLIEVNAPNENQKIKSEEVNEKGMETL